MESEGLPWIRIILIAGMLFSAVLTGVLATGAHPDYLVFPAFISVALALSLFRNTRRTERNLTLFFDAVNSNDTSVLFPETSTNPAVRKLYREMNRINRGIQALRLHAEAREQYYRAVIRQSTTGLIVMDAGGHIEMINEAASVFAGITPDSTDTRLLKYRNPEFDGILGRITAGETLTVRNTLDGKEETLLFRAREIQAGEKHLKLISIENIRRELDRKEMESYQSLIRILTHEIMNSVAPLTSVSRTLHKLFFHDGKPIGPADVSREVIEVAVKGLTTIDEQGNGLLNFVNSYRKLVRLPRPVIEPIDVAEWSDQVKLLVSEQLVDEQTAFGVTIDPGVKIIMADKNLINQVVFNLINNAVDALSGRPSGRKLTIGISRRNAGGALITVANNGPRIPADILEKIFIPFFTTKKTGTGIGLALSRQIMYLHQGSLSVTSDDERTVFMLEFPQEEPSVVLTASQESLPRQVNGGFKEEQAI